MNVYIGSGKSATSKIPIFMRNMNVYTLKYENNIEIKFMFILNYRKISQGVES